MVNKLVSPYPGHGGMRWKWRRIAGLRTAFARGRGCRVVCACGVLRRRSRKGCCSCIRREWMVGHSSNSYRISCFLEEFRERR